MNIQSVNAFSDNYIWMIETHGDVIIVDPGEAHGVLNVLEEAGVNNVTILLTHHHEDHTAGVEEIVAHYPETTVFGPIETKSLADVIVQDGDTFELYDRNFRVFKTAGHTEEHVSYLTANLLFSGDALFSGGCGRVFTGDYESQYQALQLFKSLPNEVKVYAAHEYTETNLRFALSIEPDNKKIVEALEDVIKLRKKEKSTYPTIIGREKEINVFLKAESLDEFITYRQARDDFK